MSLEHLYLAISKRSLRAADVTLGDKLQEKASFMTYHAFESAGGALCSSHNRNYPRHHQRKLNSFTAVARGRPYGLAVAALASALYSIRDLSLYPSRLSDGTLKSPQQSIAKSHVKALLGRVKGIVRAVERDI